MQKGKGIEDYWERLQRWSYQDGKATGCLVDVTQDPQPPPGPTPEHPVDGRTEGKHLQESVEGRQPPTRRIPYTLLRRVGGLLLYESPER